MAGMEIMLLLYNYVQKRYRWALLLALIQLSLDLGSYKGGPKNTWLFWNW